MKIKKKLFVHLLTLRSDVFMHFVFSIDCDNQLTIVQIQCSLIDDYLYSSYV